LIFYFPGILPAWHPARLLSYLPNHITCPKIKAAKLQRSQRLTVPLAIYFPIMIFSIDFLEKISSKPRSGRAYMRRLVSIWFWGGLWIHTLTRGEEMDDAMGVSLISHTANIMQKMEDFQTLGKWKSCSSPFCLFLVS
jgi:hypothetical protein